MMVEQAKLALIQKKGQLTIPAELRRKYKMVEGGVVAIIDEEDGIKIVPREVLARDALDRIGEVLKAQGITLEELMEEGREIRGELLEEEYDIKPTNE